MAAVVPPGDGAGNKSSFSGKTGLIAAVVVVVVLLVGLPAYRWFFAISVLIALVVAAALRLWYKYKPLKEADVNHKKPLGLE